MFDLTQKPNGKRGEKNVQEITEQTEILFGRNCHRLILSNNARTNREY